MCRHISRVRFLSDVVPLSTVLDFVVELTRFGWKKKRSEIVSVHNI